MNAIVLRLILLIGLTSILMGCQTHQTKPKPAKPTLIIQPNKGGICLDKENAVKLGTYILELENYND